MKPFTADEYVAVRLDEISAYRSAVLLPPDDALHLAKLIMNGHHCTLEYSGGIEKFHEDRVIVSLTCFSKDYLEEAAAKQLLGVEK